MVEKCVVRTDKKEYYPGDLLSGTVEIFFKTGKRVKAITVILHGEGVLKLDNANRIEPIVEEYIHEEVEILRCKKYNSAEREILLITSGEHQYEYLFNLPNNLPSTFSLKKATISYRLTVEVDIQGFLDPLYDSKFISIGSYVDLNYIPMPIKGPLRQTAINDICCLCFKMEPLSIKVELAYPGYVPSQPVDVACFVRNKSMMNVTKVTFKIVQVFEYVVKSKTHRKEKVLQKMCVPNSTVGRGIQKVFRAQLQIPENTLVPNLTNCRILKTHCELIGKAVTPYPHFDLFVSIPFSLGTVPLQVTPMPKQ